MAAGLKRLLVGKPLPTSDEHHQRLGRPTALAVFASDAISSTAYATQEILLVLVPIAGMAALDDLIPIAVVVAVLLAIVIFSYRQTIYAYPSGGGSYVVSRENLGVTASQVAGASLLFDYILTVSVAVSAGVAAIASAFPALAPERVPMCIAFIVIIAIANLRGLKESGRLFAGPTYVYVVALAILCLVGFAKLASGDLDPLPPDTETLNELTKNGTLVTGVTAFALLRAFSSGAVALTGIEAVANGVPAFRKPESRNAATTLVAMGLILGGFFMALSILTHRIAPTVSHEETLLSSLGAAIFGDGSIPYYLLQFATVGILILAANTGFADFPRVGSILATDGYLPRQLANHGDRLVFSNGIVGLATIAIILIIAFGGETSALIPLYAVGVFCCFTLSQAGMVRHHLRLKEPHWKRHLSVNAVGAFATGVVLVVVIVSKFTIGAWVPVVLIPIFVMAFKGLGRHYQRVRAAVTVPYDYQVRRHAHTVVVLVGAVNRGVLHAVAYARSMDPETLLCVSVVTTPEEQEALVAEWDRRKIPAELHTIFSPYRDLTGPILELLDELDAERPDDVVTVVIPEFVVDHLWEEALHNQSALLLRNRLRRRPNTAICSVPVVVSEHAPDEMEEA